MIRYLPLDELTASFAPELEQALLRVVRSGYYLQGPEVAAFEEEFARYIGTRHCVGVANGLDALTLSLMAMRRLYGWAAGDEVIVPDMTFVATAQAAVRAGLTPVWADVNADALLTPEAAERVLTPRTRAVVPVHLYGAAAPMLAWRAWADRYGLKVLEDAAQAHGAQVAGRRVGAWGHAAAFSFYPGKNLGALGDGGAVLTDDDALARLVRTMANYGSAQKYHHTEPGMNSRLDEVQAALLRVKLRRLDADNARRQEVARWYAEGIAHPLVQKPYGGDTARSVFHIYPVRCPYRDALQQHLAAQGVQTLIHYPLAVSRQPVFQPASGGALPPTPEAQQWAATELSLPMHPLLTREEARRVCEAINHFEHP